MIQHAQRVFAVAPGYPDQLGQDLPSFPTLGGRLISLPDRILKLSPCRHAQLPRHLRHHPAAGALQRLYESARLYVNFFQPSFKLASKCREGALVHKRYHPPLTPYQRLLASSRIDETVKQRLREQFAALDPVALLTTIRAAQHELSTLSNRDPGTFGSSDQPEYLSAFASAWHSDCRGPKARRKNTTKHWWRSRTDPFADTWPLVEGWLAAEPNLGAKELLTQLTQLLPDLYPSGAQLRTLQRRVKAWRAERARELVFGAIAGLEPDVAVNGPANPELGGARQ